MNAKLMTLLIAVSFMFGVWNCKDLPPTAGVGPVTPGTAKVSGFIQDLSTSAAVKNATVYLAVNGTTDSMVTASDGIYTFEVDLSSGLAQSALLTVRKFGYESKSFNLIVRGDTAVNVTLKIDLSTSAMVTGVLRDSATFYPLRNATVLLTLPGVVDSVTTGVDGSFALTADLVDRDSLPMLFTAYKAGYKTRKFTVEGHKGQTAGLGNVLMAVDVQSTIGQVVGRVFDRVSLFPIAGASVYIFSSLKTDSVLTASDGSYSFSIDLAGLSSVSGNLKFAKSGYKAVTDPFSVAPGQIFGMDATLDRDTTTGVRDSSATGSAHSIAFVAMTNNQISVYGVGGTESTTLTWEVRDSLGYPIDFEHRDTVEFQLSGAPVAGGAYVSPARQLTNASGRVATTVNSGTVSGVIQFVATLRRNSDGVVIQSTPVIITVNAGLPDQAHFDVAPDVHNFVAWDWVNKQDVITVQVGDKYSNPVKTNTAVYFHTTGGVIDASGFTDVSSHATVTLYSGNPRPVDPVLGPGFAWISATTIGENGTTVQDSTPVLFSGYAFITNVSAANFHTPSGGVSPSISFHVEDENGNPLAKGTHITVALQYTAPPGSDNINIVTIGDNDVLLPDIMGKGAGATIFSFQVADQTIGGVPPGTVINATVTITVTGPNVEGGSVKLQIPGTIGG